MGIQKLGPNTYRIKARVIIPARTPQETREDRRRREIFEGTKAEAEERYLAIRAELRREKPKAKYFADLMAPYRENRGGRAPSGQEAIYNNLLQDLGPTEIASLKDTLERYHGLLLKTRAKTTGELLSKSTLNRYRTMVAAILNLARAKDTIRENPLTKAVWPKYKEIPRDRYLDDQERLRVFDVVEREAYHLLAIFWYAMRVPCRKAELVNMQKPQLDLFNNAIRVFNGTTKNDEGIWKPIPEEMIPYFRSIPADCPYLFWRPGRGKQKGQYLPLGDFKRAWGRCLRLAQVRDFTFHDTRHISATDLVNAGTPERVVMAIAG